jgi:hypothetical protein
MRRLGLLILAIILVYVYHDQFGPKSSYTPGTGLQSKQATSTIPADGNSGKSNRTDKTPPPTTKPLVRTSKFTAQQRVDATSS